MSDIFFCIFCSDKIFFKNDFKEHLIKHYTYSAVNMEVKPVEPTTDFLELVDNLADYCSELEMTLTKRRGKKHPKKYLPENNVTELFDGCPLCKQIISHYKLTTADRTQKPYKHQCVCGNSEDTSGLKLITCKQCRHSYHYECKFSEDYSGQDMTQFICEFCEKMEFVINTTQDMKTCDQLIHIRQHLNYEPYKCCVDNTCHQSYVSKFLLINHVKGVHKRPESVTGGLRTIALLEQLLKANVNDPIICEPLKSVLSTSSQVSVQPITCVESTPNKFNASNFAIPRITLPAGLPDVTINYIKELIDMSERNRNLFDDRRLTNAFDDTLKSVVKSGRKLTAVQRDQILNYLLSNLLYVKQIVADKYHNLLLTVIGREVSDAILLLKKSIEKSRPEVTRKYETAVKEFKEQQRKGKAEIQMPLKLFPFDETIRTQLKDSIAAKVEYHAVVSSKDKNVAELKEYLNDFLKNDLLVLWPEGWMKFETLYQKAKPYLKAPQRSPQKIERNETNLLKTPFKLNINGDHLTNGISTLPKVIPLPFNAKLISSFNSIASTSTSTIVSKTPVHPLSIQTPSGKIAVKIIRPATFLLPFQTVSAQKPNQQALVQTPVSAQNVSKIVISNQKPMIPPPVEPQKVSSNKRNSQTLSSSANNCDDKSEETLNKKFRTESDKSLPNVIHKRKSCSIKEEEEYYINKAVNAFDFGPSSSRSSSRNSRTSTEMCSTSRRSNLRPNLNTSKKNKPDLSPETPKQELIDAFKNWTGIKNIVKSPYIPQINDEVVYLRSGHYNYMQELRDEDFITSTRTNFKVHEYSNEEYKDCDYVFAIVREINFKSTFKSKPMHSIKLKLEELDPQTKKPNETFFSIQYLKLEVCPDFIILRQSYENSIDINWTIGYSFRTPTMDGNLWIDGMIVNLTDFGNDNQFRDRNFKKFVVSLANDTCVELSPWDLEPVDEEGIPSTKKDITLSIEERLSFYRPKADDWPNFYTSEESGLSANDGRNLDSNSLSEALDFIITLKEGLMFADSSQLYTDPKPIYSIDLLTIRDRLKNYFYRRSAQIKFDLRALENNLNSLKTKDSDIIRRNYQKILKVFLKYMETDFWLRKLDAFQSDLEIQFPVSKPIDDDIQEILVIPPKSTNKPIKKETVSELPTISSQSSAASAHTESKPPVTPIIEAKYIKVERIEQKIEPKTEPQEDSKVGILQTLSTIRVKACNQTDFILKTDREVQTEALLSSKADKNTETDTKTIIFCQTESQTEVVSNSDKQIQTVCEVFPKETQTETTEELIKTVINCCEKPLLTDIQTQTDLQSEPTLIEPENKYYLCVFCKTNIYFLEKTQALAHYKSHLGGLIHCNICYTCYDSVNEFRQLDSEHSECEENISQIKEFYLTLDWIESFLDFQMTPTFNRLVRIRPEMCPICFAIKQMSAQTSVQLNAIEDDDSFKDHIYRHFNLNNVFECIKCDEQSDGQDFKFFFDLKDAETHLQTHELNIDSTKINSYFRINDTQNKKLSEAIDKYIDLNKTIEEIYKSNSIDV